jgi:hypothetical protein
MQEPVPDMRSFAPWNGWHDQKCGAWTGPAVSRSSLYSGNLRSRLPAPGAATNAAGALHVHRNWARTALSDYADIPCGMHRGRRIARTPDDEEIDNRPFPNNVPKLRTDWDGDTSSTYVSQVE